MAKEIYTPRGIRNPKLLKAFNEGERYHSLIEVLQSDLGKDLEVELRADYLNIYYRGGRIARLVSPNGCVDFDEYYFLKWEDARDPRGIDDLPHKVYVQGNKSKNIPSQPDKVSRLKEQRDALKNLFRAENYRDYFAQAKEVMDA